MTREEILEYFKDINYAYNDCTRYDTLKRMIDELQEPCNDCISRQAAINIVVCDILSSAVVYGRTEEGMAARKAIVDGLKRLPPVTPAEKVGHWILPQWDDGMSDPIYYQVRCSECGFDLDPQTFGEELKKYGADRFCPNCGSRMMQEVKE